MHTSRSANNWLPVVITDQKINECELGGDDITLYRGCDIEEFDTLDFKQRQSWAKDLSVVKAFAFNHPSGNTSLEKRVVIERKHQ